MPTWRRLLCGIRLRCVLAEEHVAQLRRAVMVTRAEAQPPEAVPVHDGRHLISYD